MVPLDTLSVRYILNVLNSKYGNKDTDKLSVCVLLSTDDASANGSMRGSKEEL